jgi:AbiV family abortive infection protein
MVKYTAEDVRVCLSNSCGLLIAASRLFRDKNLKPYSSALVELAFEELGKTLCIYQRSEIGHEFQRKIGSTVSSCERVFTDHDVKIDIMKEFVNYIKSKSSKELHSLNPQEIIKEGSIRLKLNKKERARFSNEVNRRYDINPETLKALLEVLNKYFEKDILRKYPDLIKKYERRFALR